MQEMIAYCGLLCHTCPILLATRQTNREEQLRMRIEIAWRCREQYSMDIEPADVTDCDGCRSETGRLFSGCRKCSIRNCARSKGLESCTYCPDYACGLLEELLNKEPEARTRLDKIRTK